MPLEFRRRRAILWPFASPGNPAAAPIGQAARPPIRIGARRRALVVRPAPPPKGNPPAVAFGRPWAVPVRFRRRPGAVLIPRPIEYGNQPGRPVNPWVSYRPPSRSQIRQRPGQGRVIQVRQSPGNMPGQPRPQRPVIRAILARARDVRHRVISGKLPPYQYTQPTPPRPKIVALPQVRRGRSGQAIRPRWFQPQGGGTPHQIPVVAARPRPRPGRAHLHRQLFGTIATAPRTRVPVVAARPRPRPGRAITPKWLYRGDTNRFTFRGLVVQLRRPRPTRVSVVVPRAIPGWAAGVSPALGRPGLISTRLRPRLARSVIQARPAWPPAESVPRPGRTVARALGRPRGQVLMPRKFPPSAGLIPPPGRLLVSRVSTGRLRPGRVHQSPLAAVVASQVAPAVYPDPFAATSAAG